MKNEILLITGGIGSFCNAVLKRLLHTDIKEIRIFSRDEKKQDYMRQEYKNDKIKYCIVDIWNKRSVYTAIQKADYVFHAAALLFIILSILLVLTSLKTSGIMAATYIVNALYLGFLIYQVQLLLKQKAYGICNK